MSSLNECTFQRCQHDRKNPYVMISREMAQDKSISPKAKGVLLYLLSLPTDWKIYHSQLQDGLGVGEDYINSSMDELLKSGYAERTRGRVNGQFQAYQYIIREFKKCLPDRENRPGSSGPENPGLQSNEDIHIKKTTTAAPPPAAAAPIQQKLYPCLESVDIPESAKCQLSKAFEENVVIDGIGWATHPTNPPNTSLAASIRYACNNNLSESDHKKKFQKKETAYEKIKNKFENGKVYNGAECFINENCIAFQRGMKHEQVDINQYFKMEKLVEMCKNFGIDCKI